MDNLTFTARNFTLNGNLSFRVTGTSVTFPTSGTLLTTSFFAPITGTLGSDVALSNIATFFDGPSIAQGTSGTWLVIGTVTFGSGGNSTYYVTLNDGTSTYASAASSSPSTVGSQWNSCTLSAIVTNPAGNLRISVKDTVRTDGNIKFNVTGTSKDSQIKAILVG